ncbi:NAD-dependent epimerase/dehydratase family protein [Bradyrhizobium sp. USDA 336]|uniref:NAD-dependent epimerase/dehydratase family protein n=1 Tax=Bradyrhizobium sp. USDA 336 TaxID=3156311 RepID=UPI003835232F
MIANRRLPTAEDIVTEDLSDIGTRLAAEFGRLSGKKLLVVGGGGFLGYYLVQAPLAWNRLNKGPAIDVTVYDNWIRGTPSWLNGLRMDPHLTLVTHDITNPVPSGAPDFDFIIHAASIASPVYYRKHPIETMDANVKGLRHLLEYTLKLKKSGKPLSGFLFYSTSEIYGDPTPENIPTPETYRGHVSCTGPRACYDESKRYGETLCVNFARQCDLPITMARPFNNYGPGLKISDRRVLPDFARDVFAGRDIVMLSDGSATRTFCYITDAIVGYYKILANGRKGEPYNIGTDRPEVPIVQLAESIVKLAAKNWDYTGRVVKQISADKDYLVDNPNCRCPVIDKARRELGYEPTVSLENGLERALIWYSANQCAGDA